MMPGYILVVDDEPEIRRLVKEVLEDEHYRVETAENAAAARSLYEKHRPDLVLLDIWMPDTDGVTLLKEWSSTGRAPEVPVVMMSGHATVETAVEATRHGAYDFIEKPVSMGKLLVTVGRALETHRLRRENVRLKRVVSPELFLAGKSDAMQALREQLERVAGSDAWGFITGEPGSGKTAAARYLHDHSARADCAFVELNLAAAGNVAERLFGGERDDRVTPGAFDQARGGTLVLSQVAELDRDSQGLLLQALDEGRYTRVGGHEPQSIDVRLIAISSADLAAAVDTGRFRADLFYRLNVVPLHLPPLREHHADVPDLAALYVDWLVNHEHLPYRHLSTGALNALRNYPWPGNIRELHNVIQRLLILSHAPEISPVEVEQSLGKTSARAPSATGAARELFEEPLREARDAFERAYLEHHLRKSGGNVAEVARLAGMERTHLYRKLKQLGVNPKAVKA
jgi:two-component system, NtrC family, nitrogen regulation response regulator NtrX